MFRGVKGEPDYGTCLLIAGDTVLRPDRTSIALHQHLDDMEPEAVTAPRLFVIAEPVEYPRFCGIRNPRPGIADGNFHHPPGCIPCTDGNDRLFSPELYAVGEDIVKDHPQHLVCEHLPVAVFYADVNAGPGFHLFFSNGSKVNLLHFRGVLVDAADGLDITDNVVALLRKPDNLLDELPFLFIGGIVHELGVPAQSHDGIEDLVRDGIKIDIEIEVCLPVQFLEVPVPFRKFLPCTRKVIPLLLDLFEQLVHLVLLELDLPEHLVEGSGERDHLLVPGLGYPPGEIPRAADGFHSPVKLAQGCKDKALEKELDREQEDDTQEDDSSSYDRDRGPDLLVHRPR